MKTDSVNMEHMKNANQPIKYLKNRNFKKFQSKFALKSNFQGALETDCGVKNWLIFAPKVSKEAFSNALWCH